MIVTEISEKEPMIIKLIMNLQNSNVKQRSQKDVEFGQ